MNGRPQQIFFQRRNADDQQSHEKMLSTANNQGTGNQKHRKMSLHIHQNSYYQKVHT